MRSEGCFVFAIKPLAAADWDGDPIYAVIEATGVNADGTDALAPGRFVSALTLHSQVELMREACFSAAQEGLDEVRLAQPAIFMIQWALVELFKTWGV